VIDAELRRNLRLEMTTHRLIAIPLLIALCFALAGWFSADSDVESLLLIGMALLPGLWGTRLAADALIDEVVGRTWDTQRMSGQGAGSLAWGKLLGATAVTWYGAFWLLAAASPVLLSGRVAIAPIGNALGAALFAQLAAFLGALVTIRGDKAQPRFATTLMQIGGIAAGVAMYALLELASEPKQIAWFDLATTNNIVAHWTAFLCAFWVVVGITQMMRAELRFDDGASAWIIFLMVVAIYCAGFGWWVARVDGIMPAQAGALGAAGGGLLFVAVVAAFADPNDRVRLGAWIARTRGKPMRAFWQAPAAIQALAIALAVSLAAIAWMSGQERLVMAALVAQALRDIMVIWLCAILFRRRLLATLIYLVVLNQLLPLLVGASGWLQGSAIFRMSVDWPGLSVVGLLTQMAVLAAVGILLARR
jgi:hypothetical protein